MTRVERLRQAVALLPMPAREVYRLSAAAGWSYGEIAVHLGLTIAEVEARLVEAIVMLDKLLAGEGP